MLMVVAFWDYVCSSSRGDVAVGSNATGQTTSPRGWKPQQEVVNFQRANRGAPRMISTAETPPPYETRKASLHAPTLALPTKRPRPDWPSWGVAGELTNTPTHRVVNLPKVKSSRWHVESRTFCQICINGHLWPLSNWVKSMCLAHTVWKPIKVCFYHQSMLVFSSLSWLFVAASWHCVLARNHGERLSS